MMCQLSLWGQATDDVSIVILGTGHMMCQLSFWGQATDDVSIVIVGTGHR